MGLKKYFSFIILASITFMLNIFLVFNIKNFQFFKTELMFVELFVLFAFIIASMLLANKKAGDLLAIMFFAILLTNSIYLYNIQSSIIGATMIANNMLALIFFIGQKKVKTPKVPKTKPIRKSEEIEKLIETEEEPKIIIESKPFVAGKFSKYYYKSDSAQGKRIKKENRIFFDSTAQARKAGYVSAKK